MTRCLTGDIGLKVKIPELKVKCHYCNRYVKASNIFEEIDPFKERKKSIIYFSEKYRPNYDIDKKRARKEPPSNF